MPNTLRLAVYFNDELRAIRELTVPFVIGRSQEANLTIPHPMVSRRHCLVFEDHGVIRLQDLGSLNGTYIASERVMESALGDGGEFQIGNIRFVLNPPKEEGASLSLGDSGSSFGNAEIVLNPPSDLPPPLPPSVAKPASAPLPGNKSTPSSQGMSTAPGFIKPLSLFPIKPGDGDNGVIDLNDVIDLADIADNEASNPPPLREQE